MRDKHTEEILRDARSHQQRQERELAQRIIKSGDPELIKLLPPEYHPDNAKQMVAIARGVDLTCSHLMTVGGRKRKPRGAGSWTKGKGKRVPCPMRATRFIDGQPYCDQHAPGKGHINPYYYSEEWTNLRKAALKRDKHLCQYCGNKATQADHIIARSKGGTDSLENLAACCPVCNKIAGGTLFESFADKKRFIVAARKKVKLQ